VVWELMDEVVQELMDEDDEPCVQLLVLEQLDDPLLMSWLLVLLMLLVLPAPCLDRSHPQ